jgi:hypothetical protein
LLEGRTGFHVARNFYKLVLFQEILNWAKYNLTREAVSKFFLDTDNEGRTVLHVATDFCELEVFQGIVNLAKEDITRDVVIKLLLATGNDGGTVWHVVAWCGKVNSLQKIWN